MVQGPGNKAGATPHAPSERREVLECGSPLPLCHRRVGATESEGFYCGRLVNRKRQGAAALHDAGATPHAPLEHREVLECGSPLPLWPRRAGAGEGWGIYCGRLAHRKRQGAAALHDAGATPRAPSERREVLRRKKGAATAAPFCVKGPVYPRRRLFLAGPVVALADNVGVGMAEPAILRRGSQVGGNWLPTNGWR